MSGGENGDAMIDRAPGQGKAPPSNLCQKRAMSKSTQRVILVGERERKRKGQGPWR